MAGQLQNYIKQMHEQGFSDDQIKEQLIKAGWSSAQLKEYFKPKTSESENAGKEATGEPRTRSHAKIGKFRGSKMVAQASWKLLKQDKEAMWYPILSVIVSFSIWGILFTAFIFLSFNGSFEALEEHLNEDTYSIIDYIFIFLVYFSSFFVASFFQVAIIALASGRMQGKDLGFKDGLKAASGRIGKIFIWSFLSATIGVVLRIIIERSKLLIKIVAALIGAAWSIATYFIVPVIALEDISVKDSFKKSVFVIKKTWGESLIVNIGVSFYFGLLGLAGFIVFGLSILTDRILVVAIMGGLLIIYLFMLTVISSTLTTIFKFALYRYASTGTIPPGFPPEALENAFKQR